MAAAATTIRCGARTAITLAAAARTSRRYGFKVTATAAAAPSGRIGADAAAAPSPLVQVAMSGAGVATLTLASPARRNALSTAMMTAVMEALERATVAERARVVVVQALGPVFCAGHDLSELAGVSGDAKRAEAVFAQCAELMMRVVVAPVPVVAAVHGLATAAGCQLAASCDIVVASQSAAFATPGVNIGLFCSTPAVAVTRTMSPKVAAAMLFTGEPITAADAFTAGLVSRVVDGGAAEVQAAAAAIAATIASKPTAVVRLGKRGLRSQSGLPLRAAYEMATAVMTANLVTEPDAAEGITAFLQKRAPAFDRGGGGGT